MSIHFVMVEMIDYHSLWYLTFEQNVYFPMKIIMFLVLSNRWIKSRICCFDCNNITTIDLFEKPIIEFISDSSMIAQMFFLSRCLLP